MTAYRRVYDSRHLQADCQEPGSAPEPYARSVIEYGLPFFNELGLRSPGAKAVAQWTLKKTANPADEH